MTTSPSGREDYAGLLEFLLAINSEDTLRIAGLYTNPDGPEAHAAIIKLEEENAKLRKALKPLVDAHAKTEYPYCFSAINEDHLRHAAEALRAVKEG